MYFKILKNDMTHYGFTYHEGLNTDTKPFDKNPECGGGLFFSDEKNILDFCDYGDKIAIVTVPEGELIVPVANKYKAHSIVLSDIKNLWTAETFEWLISLGVDIHVEEDYVLKYASYKGYLEIVKCLVKHGADIHINDDYVLRRAAEYDHLEVVKFLVEQGADIRADDDYVLWIAIKKEYLDIVKYFMEHVINTSVDYNDILKYAVGLNIHYKNPDITKYLTGLQKSQTQKEK